MGGFLTIDYCLRIIAYCFPYCFLEIFVGDKALMNGDRLVMGISPIPSARENPVSFTTIC